MTGGIYSGSICGRAGVARPLDLGDGQQLVAAAVLGGKQEPRIEPAELDLLLVAAAILVLDRDHRARVTGVAVGRFVLHIGAAQLRAGDGQENAHGGRTLESLLKPHVELLLFRRSRADRLAQVEPVRLLVGFQGDDRPVAHPRRSRWTSKW